MSYSFSGYYIVYILFSLKKYKNHDLHQASMFPYILRIHIQISNSIQSYKKSHKTFHLISMLDRKKVGEGNRQFKQR